VILKAIKDYLDDVSMRVEFLYNASLLQWDAKSKKFIAGQAGVVSGKIEGGIPMPPPPPPPMSQAGGPPPPPPPPPF
jgi:hypothetical protein